MKRMKIRFPYVERALYFLNVLGHRGSQEVLKLLEKNTELNVTELCDKLLLKQSDVSIRLAKLMKAKIITVTKRGKFNYYRLNIERLQIYKRIIQSLLENK